MKIVIIQHYYIESYYKVDATYCVDYSSVEDLKRDIQAAAQNFKNQRETYEKELNDWRKKEQEFKETNGYENLFKELESVKKTYNRRAGSTKKVDRTYEWKIEQGKIKQKIEDLQNELSKLNEMVPAQPFFNSAIQIGPISLDFPYVYQSSPEETLKEFEFYTLEDWANKFTFNKIIGLSY